jgi:ATP-dependent RNA helicase RhlE
LSHRHVSASHAAAHHNTATRSSHTPHAEHPKPHHAANGVRFADLNLAPALLRALTDEGYETPTPIQAQAIPPIMQGSDVLGCAQTGTGKTAAFALPILHRLLTIPIDMTRRGPALPRVLILSPTRELASQIGESFATYGRHASLAHTVIFGGVGQYHQVKALHRGVDILVATPGRLIDLMEQRLTNFSAVQMLVLDEADRMLDMGFINPIRQIAKALPSPRQTLLFSATMPREIQHLADSLLHNPVKVTVAPVASTAALIEQSLYMVARNQKPALLEHILTEQKVSRAVVFTRTKHGADRVAKRLNFSGITATAIHGNKAQNQRQRALDAFRTGRCRVLVATDVAARGLDVDGISHVFNFDLPNEPEAYVHRIGRTGRAGAKGLAISFCDHDERPFLRDIERLIAKRIPLIATPELLPTSPSHAAPSHPASHAATNDQPSHDGRERHDARGSHGTRGTPRSTSDHAPRSSHGLAPRSSPTPAPRSSHTPRAPHAPHPARPARSDGHRGQSGAHDQRPSRPTGNHPRSQHGHAGSSSDGGHHSGGGHGGGHRGGAKRSGGKRGFNNRGHNAQGKGRGSRGGARS